MEESFNFAVLKGVVYELDHHESSPSRLGKIFHEGPGNLDPIKVFCLLRELHFVGDHDVFVNIEADVNNAGNLGPDDSGVLCMIQDLTVNKVVVTESAGLAFEATGKRCLEGLDAVQVLILFKERCQVKFSQAESWN